MTGSFSAWSCRRIPTKIWVDVQLYGQLGIFNRMPKNLLAVPGIG
jgi:hypothetical protein